MQKENKKVIKLANNNKYMEQELKYNAITFISWVTLEQKKTCQC